MEFSAVAKILIVFFGVLAVSRMRVPLGAGLIGGGLALDLWAGKTIQAIPHDLWQALMRPELWLLAITITLIMEIGHFMAWDENGRAVINQQAELVCTAPFPSMPISFWNDPDGSRASLLTRKP